jgi:hypothetical protein
VIRERRHDPALNITVVAGGPIVSTVSRYVEKVERALDPGAEDEKKDRGKTPCRFRAR